MGNALERGMVLVMSIWDDHYVNMLWLDSNYPTDVDPSQPGVARGSCATDSGLPAGEQGSVVSASYCMRCLSPLPRPPHAWSGALYTDIEVSEAGSSVTYSNIKVGALDSTYDASAPRRHHKGKDGGSSHHEGSGGGHH